MWIAVAPRRDRCPMLCFPEWRSFFLRTPGGSRYSSLFPLGGVALLLNALDSVRSGWHGREPIRWECENCCFSTVRYELNCKDPVDLSVEKAVYMLVLDKITPAGSGVFSSELARVKCWSELLDSKNGFFCRTP